MACDRCTIPFIGPTHLKDKSMDYTLARQRMVDEYLEAVRLIVKKQGGKYRARKPGAKPTPIQALSERHDHDCRMLEAEEARDAL